MIYFSDSVAQCNIWRQQFFFKLLLATKCYNDNKYKLTSSEVSFSFGYGKRPKCISIW